MLTQNLVPKVPTNFTRTAPLMKKPFDLPRLQAESIAALNAKKRDQATTHSLLDVAFNQAVHNRIQKDKWFEHIPVVDRIISTAISMWELDKVLFNVTQPVPMVMGWLRNFGETLDVVALLVKAPLFAWTSGGSVTVGEAYKRAYGFQKTGRQDILFEDISKS